MKKIAEIEARLAQIKIDMDVEGADISALTAEADALIEERSALMAQAQSRSALLGKIAGLELGTATAGNVTNTVASKTPVAAPEADVMESRGEALISGKGYVLDAIESRSLLVSGGTIAKPTKVSGINDNPGQASSIIDMVNVEDCTGLGTDRVAYISADSTAAAATEGNAATSSDSTFAYVDITPTAYNLISYVSNEIANQSPLNYAAKVQAQALKALRRKAAAVVTDAIKSSALNDETTIITSIGADTLRKIVLNYGSDETIEGNAVLFLNKTDLIAFGDVRGTNEKKAVYEITPDGANPNTGVIKDGGLSVRYCINPNCDALTGGTNVSTTATKPTMFYGNPLNAKLDLFGGYKIDTSKDYKFAEGLLSVLGSMSIGAGVVVNKGFYVVSIAKAT